MLHLHQADEESALAPGCRGPIESEPLSKLVLARVPPTVDPPALPLMMAGAAISAFTWL